MSRSAVGLAASLGRRKAQGLAMPSAGTAGSTYTPRLPELALKNTRTMTTHTSSTAVNVSRLRSASRQRGQSQGTSATSGSQRNGTTSTK